MTPGPRQVTTIVYDNTNQSSKIEVFNALQMRFRPSNIDTSVKTTQSNPKLKMKTSLEVLDQYNLLVTRTCDKLRALSLQEVDLAG